MQIQTFIYHFEQHEVYEKLVSWTKEISHCAVKF